MLKSAKVGIKLYKLASYRIAGNFDVFDAFQPDRQYLTRQIFKAIQCLVKDTDHPSKYSCQIFEKSASVKISPRQNFPLYSMSFHNTATCVLTFYHSDQTPLAF